VRGGGEREVSPLEYPEGCLNPVLKKRGIPESLRRDRDRDRARWREKEEEEEEKEEEEEEEEAGVGKGPLLKTRRRGARGRQSRR
jgi:hypothetical protein